MRRHAIFLPLIGGLAVAALDIVGIATLAHAAPARNDGLFITVGTITSEEKDRIEGITLQAVKRFRADGARRDQGGDKRIYRIVFDFNPDERANSSGDFGACYELATFLMGLDDDVVTVAFVHGSVTEHSVLPALACTGLVMSSTGTLGEVRTKNKFESDFYLDVLKNRHRNALAPALRMLDSKVRIRRVFLLPDKAIYVDTGAVPADAGELAEILIDGKKTTVRIDPKESVAEDPAVPGTASFNAERAKKFGLCQRKLESRSDIISAFDMPPTSLRGDPLLGRKPIPWRIDVEGQINRAREQSYRRQIDYARGKGANLIIVRLRDCADGDFQPALDLAHYLRQLKDDDDRPITTVAYISEAAPDTATIIALGCSSIIMRRGATIGDFHNRKFVEPDPARNEQRIEALKDLARQQGYAEALIEGMMIADVRLVRVEDKHGEEHEWRVLTEAEAKKDERWSVVEEVKPKGELLILSADRARDLNLAQEVLNADEDDLGPLYKYLAVRAKDVHSSKRDWLDAVADFLCSDFVSVLLVMVGIICLILEFKLPGATLPIVIAAVCFILYFWAHSQLSGQFPWLAVLLFVLGLIFLALEIFVFPGSVVMGVAGIVLVLLSLVLATLQHKPESPREWFEFGKTLTIFGAAILGAIGIALFLASHVHQIPVLNRLVLRPAGDVEDEDEEPLRHANEPHGLLGAIGVSATPLRPAGKVQFGEEFVDVVAEGGFIGPGTRVQVVEIEGNRVVVKEV